MDAPEVGATANAVPQPEPMTDREAWESSLPVRVLRGVEAPAITLMKMVGPDSIKKQLAEIDALRESGMKKRGNEGFDWGGLAGSLGSGIAIGGPLTKAATAVLGPVLGGATSGAAMSMAQPLPGDNELSTDKLAQGATGAVVGGAIPLATKAVKSFVGTNRLNPTQQATLREGQAAGYTVPPSTVNPSGLNNTIESVAGKAAIGQEAAARNQRITNAMTARALGLADDTPITEDVLHGIRDKAGDAYKRVAELDPGGELRRLQVRSKIAQSMEPGPVTGLRITETTGTPATTGLRVGEIRDDAGRLIGMKVGKKSEGVQAALEGLKGKVVSRGQDVPGPLKGMKVSVTETRGGNPLEQLKQARADSNAFFKHYARSADPESLRKARELVAKAKAIEQGFEQRALKSGKPELIEDLRKARELIAKTYDVERALNIGDSNISAPILGRQLDQVGSKAKSGGIATIGKMAEAFPSVMREGAKVPTAGVSGTDAAASAILGTLGYGAGGPAGLTAAALPLMRPIARNLALSPTYQKYIAEGMSPQMAALLDAMTRQAIGAAGTTAGRMQQ